MLPVCFSALQRAEIAEIRAARPARARGVGVSVLFNEPKLLKCSRDALLLLSLFSGFSALQRAEIAEIAAAPRRRTLRREFQCSSTSRNC